MAADRVLAFNGEAPCKQLSAKWARCPLIVVKAGSSIPKRPFRQRAHGTSRSFHSGGARKNCDEFTLHIYSKPRMQLTTDSLNAYLEAVEGVFGADIDFAHRREALRRKPEHRP